MRLILLGLLLLFSRATSALDLYDTSDVFKGTLYDEVITRDANTVDIQACVRSILSDDRVPFQIALRNFLVGRLASTSLFLTRVYSNTAGDYCFLYVYQGADPAASRQAVTLINPQGTGSGASTTVQVAFTGASGATMTWPVAVTASPWQAGSSNTPLGVPLPNQWSAEDFLMWSVAVGGALLFLALVACCCIVRATFVQDSASMASIMEADRTVLSVLSPARLLAAKPR